MKSVNNAITDLGFLRVEPTSFAHCPSDSIDFAVMELTKKGVVVPVDIGWSDVGSQVHYGKLVIKMTIITSLTVMSI